MEKAQEILKKYLDGDKLDGLFKELKDGGVHFAGEENLDIRYGKLKNDMDEKTKLYDEAQKHIEELTKSAHTTGELKAKQAEYEKRIKALENENNQIKIDSALNQELLKAKAKDTEFLIFKIKKEYQNKKTPCEFGEDGKLKGLNEILSDIKSKHSSLFESDEITKDVNVLNVGKGEQNTQAQPKNLLEALKERYTQKQ